MLVIRNIDITVRQVGGPRRFEPRRFESILNHVCHERMSRASTSTDQQNEQVSLYTHAPEIYLLLFITLDQIKGFFLSLFPMLCLCYLIIVSFSFIQINSAGFVRMHNL